MLGDSVAMKSLSLLLILFLLAGCGRNQRTSDVNYLIPAESLPADIRAFPVRAGMTLGEANTALRPLGQTVDPSKSQDQTCLVLKGPYVDNPWSGIYWIAFKTGVVSEVRFTVGNLNVQGPSWVLSER
jgi:hypothetical protein